MPARASDVGRLRTGNEDSFLVDDRLALYAVADGMGGHNAGEIASATAIEALRAAVGERQGARRRDRARELGRSSRRPRPTRALRAWARRSPRSMLGDSTMLIGHVGDSRGYRIRGGTLEQLTEDHSLVEELVREGRLSPEEAEVHPRRSVITRALGIDPRVDVDLYTIDAQTGDRILLCSDGLTTMLRDEEVLRIAQHRERSARRGRPARRRRQRRRRRRQHHRPRHRRARRDRRPRRPIPRRWPPRGVAHAAADRGTRCRPSRNRVPQPLAPAHLGGLMMYVLPVVVIIGIGIGADRLVRAPHLLRRLQGRPGGGVPGRSRRDPRVEADGRRPPRSCGAPSSPRRDRPDRQLGQGLARARASSSSPTSSESTTTTTTSTTSTTRHHDDDQPHDEHHRQRAARDRLYATLGRQRRNAELGLGFLAVVVTSAATSCSRSPTGRRSHPISACSSLGIVGLYVVAHIAVRRLAPRAGGHLAAARRGAERYRLRHDRAHRPQPSAPTSRIQSVWSAVGVGAFVLTLLVVRNVRTLERYTYTFAFVALGAAARAARPARSALTFNGARIWAHIGPLHFQPGEPAKVLWVAFFAGYLTQKRELLSEGSRSIGRLRLPAARHLGPLIVTWGVSILVLVFEKDLGSSLLFFARVRRDALHGDRAQRVPHRFARVVLRRRDRGVSHVRPRTRPGAGLAQPVAVPTRREGATRSSSRGTRSPRAVSTARGSGSVHPTASRYASTDFIFAAIGEELGLLGTLAIVVVLPAASSGAASGSRSSRPARSRSSSPPG